MKISFVVQSPNENIIYSVCSSPPIFLNCVGSYSKECPKPKLLVVASGVYFTFGIDNLVTWPSSKQNPVTRSRVQVLIQLLKCLKFVFSFWTSESVFLLLWKCTVAIMQLSLMLATKLYISATLTVVCRYIRDLLMNKLITYKHILTLYVLSEDKLGDILTKLLARSSFQQLTFKLGKV